MGSRIGVGTVDLSTQTARGVGTSVRFVLVRSVALVTIKVSAVKTIRICQRHKMAGYQQNTDNARRTPVRTGVEEDSSIIIESFDVVSRQDASVGQ